MIDVLKQKIKTKQIIKKVYYKIIDDLRGIGIHIPEAVLRRVALDMKNAYPDTFEERDEEGNIL